MTVRAGLLVGPALRIGYVALLLAGLGAATAILVTAGTGGSLGYDYRAYDLVVDRLFAGQSMYDLSLEFAGPFGLYLYPPPFALMVLPITLLPLEIAIPVWTILLVAMSVASIALLPVSRTTRWIVLLLASVSWPLIYGIKLGQVGPILLLMFAVGWRWMDRAWPLGVASAIGTIIKIQPALLIVWAALTGRWRAAAIGVVTAAAVSLLATIVTGPGAWFDFAGVVSRINRPLDTPHSFGFARIALEGGLSLTVATIIHWLNLGLTLAVVGLAIWRASAVGSYLAVVVASQLTSPVLWDHYALILLLPAAWLIHRRQWWAALIPLATSTPLLILNLEAPIIYPLAFWAALLGVTWAGLRESRLPKAPPSLAGAPAR